MEKIKIWIRDFLLGLAKIFDPSTKGPVLRNTRQFFKQEIKVPSLLSIIATYIIVYFMLLSEIGYSYQNAIVIAFLTTVIAYVFISECRKEKSLASDPDAIVLICLIFIIALLVMQICDTYLSIIAFPVSAFVIMGTMLLSPRIGLVFAVLLSIIIAFLHGWNFDDFAIMLGSGLIVLTMAKNIRRRIDFVKAALASTVAIVLLTGIFYLLKHYSLVELERNFYFVLKNGALSLALLLVLIPILERIFSRATNIKLIELSDFSNPLLKRLMLEASGTYHHVIMTAGIAEQAAMTIGENPVLARVASYYHDIGKLQNPQYFIENQKSGENPHDSVSTAMSTLILTSHIKDGIALAKKHNLDKDIIDCIAQHHGVTVMGYFYRKERELNGGENHLKLDDFRYPGPKPQTKMAAIIMLSDSCEAACRSLDEQTNVKISETVDRIIKDKLEDGQFSECPITLKEIELIKESVMSALISMYHQRIKYEETDDKDAQKE